MDEFRRITAIKEEAERAALRQYRNALWDYNDGIRQARKKYDDALDAANTEWVAGIEKLDALERDAT